MEILKNSGIIAEIDLIECINGGNSEFTISFTSMDKKRHKLAFGHVWDLRYSIENGNILRFYKFKRMVDEESDILLVEDSQYLEQFKKQAEGTLPFDDLKHYIIFDRVDTVIDILTNEPPVLL